MRFYRERTTFLFIEKVLIAIGEIILIGFCLKYIYY